MTKSLTWLISTTVAAAALLLGLLGAESRIVEEFPSIGAFLDEIVIGVAALLAASGVTTIALCIYLTTKGVKSRIKEKFPGLGWDFCKRSEIDQIQALADMHLPEPTGIDQTLALYDHNKKSVIKIVDNRCRNKIVGYAFLMPLNNRGVEKISQKTFSVFTDDLTAFNKNGLRKKIDYYIGAVVGENKQAQGKALEIVRLFCNKKEIKRLFAKAATKDGLRVLRRRGFRPFSEDDIPEIGVLFVKEMN